MDVVIRSNDNQVNDKTTLMSTFNKDLDMVIKTKSN